MGEAIAAAAGTLFTLFGGIVAAGSRKYNNMVAAANAKLTYDEQREAETSKLVSQQNMTLLLLIAGGIGLLFMILYMNKKK